MKQTVLFLSLVLTGMLGGACQSPAPLNGQNLPQQPIASPELIALSETNRSHIEWLEPPKMPFQLGPGDRIAIDIIGDESDPISTFVGPDGKIYFHLLPGQPVWGLSVAETESLLQRELAQYLQKPEVTINVLEVKSRSVWLLGRLRAPGIYSLENPTTLLECISKAGGLDTEDWNGTGKELADLRHSFLMRAGEIIPVDLHRLLIEGDMKQNIYLQNGDYVYFPSVRDHEVYVLGAVTSPRVVSFKAQMTLMSALAGARGTADGAYLTHVAIVRGSLANPSIAIVDVVQVRNGTARDVLLQPQDIVYVPFSPFRKLSKYADLIVNTFARTVSVNEGIRATSEISDPVRVNIGLGE